MRAKTLAITFLFSFLAFITSAQNYQVSYYIGITNKFNSKITNEDAWVPLTPYYKTARIPKPHKVCRLDTNLTERELQKLKASPGVLYIEKANVYEPLWQPNDPAANSASGGQAEHLHRMEVYAGWDSARGDTQTMIGILDTGVDINHPDMGGNIARNYGDPINGIDDDGNGLIDDNRGWDFGDNDNDPRPAGNAHGTQVACISSAVADNAVGLAGLAYRCRMLPVKVFGARFRGYEAIIYAADRGCKVINLSWGANGYPSQYEQDIIDYAVQTKGAVVVAAAGNTAGVLRFYPASYDGVISVGFGNLADERQAASTQAPELALHAPGFNVYGILSNGSYGIMGGGSSFAAPMVSALAALVMSKYPQLTAAEVGAALKAGVDWIDTVPVNRTAAGYIGRGRINFRKTLAAPLPAYPEVLRLQTAPQAAALQPGVAPLYCTVKNWLQNCTRLVVRLSLFEPSPGVSIIGPDSLVFNNLTKDYLLANLANWQIIVGTAPSLPPQIRVELKADGRTFNQVVRLDAGAALQDLANLGSRLTLAANARLGYVDDANSFGAGYTRLGRRLLGEGGIIIAQDSTDVRNNLSSTSATKDNDFIPLTPLKTVRQDSLQVLEAQTLSAPGGNRMAIQVGLKGYAWPQRADRPGLLVEHTIFNRGTQALDSLRFGVFADWDLNRYWLNQMRWDSAGGFGYAYAFGDSAYVALVPLTPGISHSLFAIDGVPLTVLGNIDVTDGFSRVEKWRALARDRRSAGGQAGTNVLAIHKSRLPRIAPGSSTRVAYAWVSGPSVPSLREAASLSRESYKLLRQGRTWPLANQISICYTDSGRYALTLPPGQWRISDSAGQVLGVAQGIYRFSTLTNAVHFRGVQVDSLFEGPTATIRIQIERLNDELRALPDTLRLGLAYPLPSISASAGDTVQVLLTNLATGQTSIYDRQDSLVMPLAGRFAVCRSMRSQLGCSLNTCDTIVVAAEPVGLVAGLGLSLSMPYPSPTTGVLYLPGGMPAEQIIYDTYGKICWKGRNTVGHTLDVSAWPKGTYLWRCGTFSKAWVLQ